MYPSTFATFGMDQSPGHVWSELLDAITRAKGSFVGANFLIIINEMASPPSMSRKEHLAARVVSAGTTFYVEKCGTGNTGRVAKY